jgi:ATP-binding cassette subfamily B protein
LRKGGIKGFTIAEDEITGKAYDSRLMKRLLVYLKPYSSRIGLAVVLLLVAASGRLVGPYLTKIAIDNYILPGDYSGLLRLALLFVGILFLMFFLILAQTYLMQWIGQHLMFDLRRQVITHLQKLSVRFHDRNPVGRLVTRVTTDVESLNEVLSSGLVAIFGDLFMLVGIVIVMLYMNTELALVTFSVVPPLFYVTFLFRKRVRESFRNIRKRIARINAFLQESISGMSIVQLFSREEKNFQEFDKLNHAHLDAFLKTIFYFAIFYPTVSFISYLAMGATIAYGGWKTGTAAISLGVLIAFIQYAQYFFRPISDLAEKYNILQGAMAAAERIFKILDEKPEILPPARPEYLGALQNSIEFRGVSFAYNEDEYVLKDISLEIEKGQTIAIVGATGAGKTSMINLLCRFYDPQKGQILLDGIDIRSLSLEDLRERIAIVQQDIFIFSGSIAHNIHLGEDFSQERIESSARHVSAHQFIERLEQGYDTDVRERGSLLSMGQRQLLAFARALAFDPEILILDEATASVDSHTESLIQDALDKLLSNRTSIVIAHRLSTIKHSDQIVVLHKGQIREKGTHDELLKLDGIYRKLYEIQYEDHIHAGRQEVTSSLTQVEN